MICLIQSHTKDTLDYAEIEVSNVIFVLKRDAKSFIDAIPYILK